MSKVKTVKRCYSCGSVLQIDDPVEPGFIKSEKLLHTPVSRVVYCDKCYDEANFSFSRDEPTIEHDYLELINQCAKDNALIIYVIDLFNFEASFNKDVIDILKDNRVIVIGNKLDLLPENTDKRHLKLYVGQYLREIGLRVSNDDIFLCSLSGCEKIDKIVKHIESVRDNQDAYIIGSQGSGKSLFCSSFLRSFENNSNELIVTTYYPNTNLKLMRVPLDGKYHLFDTPGSSIDNNIVCKLENEVALDLRQFNNMKSRDYKLTAGDAIFIGGLGIIELVSTNNNEGKELIKAYFPPCVKIKKKISKRTIREHFENCIERESLVPTTRYVKSIKDFDILEVTIEERGQRDIGIAGLGWIAFPGNGQVFRCYVPKDVSIYTTRSKIYVNK